MGSGDGVSVLSGVAVDTSVAVAEIASVGADGVKVLVMDENAVLVGSSVSARVGGTAVEMELQAKETSINRIGKMSFLLINMYSLHTYISKKILIFGRLSVLLHW